MHHPTNPKLVAVAVAALILVIAPGCSDGQADDASPSTVRSTTQEQPTDPDPSTTSATPTTPSRGADDPVVLDEILRRAIQEELDAEATYRAVIVQVGAVRPFTNIAESEAQHVQALEDLAERYGVPTDDLVSEPQPSPATRPAACELGTAAEEADVALYDELLPQVQAYPDVVQVLTNLRRASLEEHLPAFERCS